MVHDGVGGMRPKRGVRVGRRYIWRLLVVIGGALAAAASARAQGSPEEQALDSATLEELMRIPLSAPAKVAQPIREAPGVGSLVTRDQIDTYGWLTLDDILFRQPGFAPAQDFERVTVAARGRFEGWNNNHLLTLVDGVPFNNTANGFAYTWDVLPLAMVESVEIMRGPGSALYGTNATNGVVAINTRSPVNARPVEARLRLGNAGTQSYELFGGYTFAPLQFVAAYGHQRTDGNVYDSFDASAAPGALATFAVKDRHASHYLFAKVAGRDALTGLSLQVHYQRWDFQTGHGWLYVIPDEDERARNDEARAWVTYRPPPFLEDRLQLELVALGQRHDKDYRIKFLRNGAQLTLAGTPVTYPGGVVEVLATRQFGLFARAQLQYRAWRELTLLLGVEDAVQVWGDDRHHSANADLNNGGTLAPFPGGEFRPIRSTVEKGVNEPINNLSLFSQLSSGRVLASRMAATLGVRYDIQSFDYTAIDDPGRPRRHRSFDQVSPRLALVGFPHDILTLKLLVERAFRAPSSSELFAANSWLASSNTEQLQPEQLTTVTLAGDLAAGRHLTLRADWFYERFENQIAFSASQNRSANLYSRTLTGVETEILFDAPLGAAVVLDGFANYTFAHLLSEKVLEPTITARDRLTWSPEHVFNLGVSVQRGPISASAQGHYQGRVRRRDSDHFGADGTPTFFSGLRPPSVAPWFQLDARVSYWLSRWMRLGVQGTNLLDAEAYLVKISNHPFDYRVRGIRVLGTLELVANLGP